MEGDDDKIIWLEYHIHLTYIILIFLVSCFTLVLLAWKPTLSAARSRIALWISSEWKFGAGDQWGGSENSQTIDGKRNQEWSAKSTHHWTRRIVRDGTTFASQLHCGSVCTRCRKCHSVWYVHTYCICPFAKRKRLLLSLCCAYFTYESIVYLLYF